MKSTPITPICEITKAHNKTVDSVRTSMPSAEHTAALAELFKIFGDGTRVKILSALSEAELCVCDIALLLDMSVSAISHQLRVLKHARLIKFRRSGKTVFYSLSDDHVRIMLRNGLDHIHE